MSKVYECRVCRSTDLEPFLDLGEFKFTGHFPKSLSEEVPSGYLDLVLCLQCSLCQLGHNFEPELLYGMNYGYRSGLNQSMVRHLEAIADRIIKKVQITPKTNILDIGCNDGTLINYFSRTTGATCYGLDPTLSKFESYIDSKVIRNSDFFSHKNLVKLGISKVDVITSIAMFYDLEDPVNFCLDISNSLSDLGIWCLEQGYAPWMQEPAAFDTICHEHLEYYSLQNLVDIVSRVGLEVIDASLNDSNGGSIFVTVAHKGVYPIAKTVDWILGEEIKRGSNSVAAWRNFAINVESTISSLGDLLSDSKLGQGGIGGIGASTKGNVLLQALGLNTETIALIGEVNPEKFGAFTPGTNIPIVPEDEVYESNLQNLIVLPWHFKEGILKKAKEKSIIPRRIIFPLPRVEIIEI